MTTKPTNSMITTIKKKKITFNFLLLGMVSCLFAFGTFLNAEDVFQENSSIEEIQEKLPENSTATGNTENWSEGLKEAPEKSQVQALESNPTEIPTENSGITPPESKNSSEAHSENGSSSNREGNGTDFPQKFYSSLEEYSSDENFSQEGIQEALPLYLLNHQGRLIAVPGMKLELMDEILRTLAGESTQEKRASLPDFLFHSVTADGIAEKNVIRLKVRFQIETFSNSVVCVPLRFDEGILLDSIPDFEISCTMEKSNSKDAKNSVTLTTSENRIIPENSGTIETDIKSEDSSKAETGIKSESSSEAETGIKSEDSSKAETGIKSEDSSKVKTGKKSEDSSKVKTGKKSESSSVVEIIGSSESHKTNKTVEENTSSNSSISSTNHKVKTGFSSVKRYSGPGQVWIEFSEKTGFSAWISGKGVHKIELTFLIPFAHALSGENQLRLHVPYATMSEMNLAIPQTRKESEAMNVSMTGGTMLQAPHFVPDSRGTEEKEKKDSGTTQISVIRLGGDFWLSWSVMQQEKVRIPDILEVEGLILAVIGQDAVTYDARLKVLRKGNEVNSFRILLPANAELIPQNSPDYTLTCISNGNSKKNGTLRGTLVEASLKKPVDGQVRVDIHARLPLPTGKAASEWFDIAGFEVLSAVRQSGCYAIRTIPGKHINWTPGGGMRRLEELPVQMDLWEPVKNIELSEMFSKQNPGVDSRMFYSISTSASTTENTLHPQTETPAESNEKISAVSSESLMKEKNENFTGTKSEKETKVQVSTLKSTRESQETSAAVSTNSEMESGKLEDSAKTQEEKEKTVKILESVKSQTSSDPYISRPSSGREIESSEEFTLQDWDSNENVLHWDAVFEYDTQPTQLWIRTVERTTRVNIEPKYSVSVQQDRLILDATWNCTIRGGKISWLDVHLNGWKFISCGPENLVAEEQINDLSSSEYSNGSNAASSLTRETGNQKRVKISENSTKTPNKISIPFNQPMRNHFVLTFRAERPISATEGIFEFQLPQKCGSGVPQIILTSTPAELRIFSAPNLEVTPRTAECRRLVRQLIPSSAVLRDLKNPAVSTSLFYRCESEDAFFSANFNIHERQTHIMQYTQAEVYRQEYRIRQTFDYSVTYESINQLHFLVPEVNIENLQLFINDSSNSAHTVPGYSYTQSETRVNSMKPLMEFPGRNVVVNEKRNVVSGDSMDSGISTDSGEPIFVEESDSSEAHSELNSSSVKNQGVSEPSSNIPVISETGTVNIPVERTGTVNSGKEAGSVTGSAVPVPTVQSSVTSNPSVPVQPELVPVPGSETSNLIENQYQPVLKFRPSQNHPGFMEVNVLLPEERLGTFTVTISYTLPMPKLVEKKRETVNLLISSSEDGLTLENILELAADECLELVSPAKISQEGSWEEMGIFLTQNQFRLEKEFGGKPRNMLPNFLCKSKSTQNSVPIEVNLRSVIQEKITIVDRCWLQTWIAGRNRQDRVAFLFPPMFEAQTPGNGTSVLPSESVVGLGIPNRGTTAVRTITIQLPQRASADTAEVWIDRKPARLGSQIKRLSANSIQVVLLPSAQPFQPQLVEIRYQFEDAQISEGVCEMEIPYVKDSTWVRGLYWQLVLPSDTHIFQPPKGFSLEYRWGWNQCFWGRVPLWEQKTLENWVGTVPGTPVPQRMNRYVLAGMGANDVLTRKIHIVFLNRTTLVTGLGAVVFVTGILLVYLGIFRIPFVRFVLLLLLGGFAVRFPEFALLGVQAATLGVLIFFVSMMCGLKKHLRHRLFIRSVSDDSTDHQTQLHQTIITPSESSRHAFKTVTYEQNLGVSSGDFSTVIRK